MHIHVLDQYRHADSPVHRLDPRVKLVSALFFILACALTPDGAWPAFVALALLWLAVTLMADVSLTLLLRRGLIALPFMLAAVTVLFTIAGAPLLTIPLPFSNHTLVITDNGVIRFFTIMLKSWLSVLMALLLSATTTFPDILRALRGIGVPNVLVGVIGFMYRYMFVLGDEVLRLMRAREARMAWGPPGQKHGGTVEWLGDDTVRICAAGFDATVLDPTLCGKVRASILFAGPLVSLVLSVLAFRRARRPATA